MIDRSLRKKVTNKHMVLTKNLLDNLMPFYFSRYSKTLLPFFKNSPNLERKLLFINKKLIEKNCVPIGLTLRFNLYLACNANCIMCSWSEARHNVSTQSYERLMRLLDFVDPKTISKIYIVTGGEPLMDKAGLIRFMRKTLAKGYSFCFTTNGSLLTKNYLDLLVKNGLREIDISLDSHIPKVHDAIRGIKNLGSSIVVILKYARKNHPDLKINILATIMKININSILGLVKMVNNLGLSSLYFGYVENRNKNFSRLRLTNKDIEKINLIKKSRDVLMSKVPITWDFCNPHAHGNCTNRYHMLNISETGEIYLCPRYPLEKKYILNKPLRTLLKKKDLWNFFSEDKLHCNVMSPNS